MVQYLQSKSSVNKVTLDQVADIANTGNKGSQPAIGKD